MSRPFFAARPITLCWVNGAGQMPTWQARRLTERVGKETTHEGSWADWRALIKSDPWRRRVRDVRVHMGPLSLTNQD